MCNGAFYMSEPSTSTNIRFNLQNSCMKEKITGRYLPIPKVLLFFPKVLCLVVWNECQGPAWNRTTRRPPDHGKETQITVVRSCLPFIRSGQNHLASYSERGKKTKQTDEGVGRQHQEMEWPGVRQVPEAVENREKWRKLAAKSCVVPQRPLRLREYMRWDEMRWERVEQLLRIVSGWQVMSHQALHWKSSKRHFNHRATSANYNNDKTTNVLSFFTRPMIIMVTLIERYTPLKKK